jgi:hypothetical protein
VISEFIFIGHLYVLILAAGFVTAFFFCAHPLSDEGLAHYEAPVG